jgi:hypothetical protein
MRFLLSACFLLPAGCGGKSDRQGPECGPGTVDVGGECVPADGGPDADADSDADSDTDSRCDPPLSDCGGDCVDTNVSDENCGGCAVDCSDGGSCVDGACLCGAETCDPGQGCEAGTCACPEGLTDCGDHCADLLSDRMDCGRCGERCIGGCTNGRCDCGRFDECATEAGGTVCTDTDLDPLNCGGCESACGIREWCADGACSCRPGLSECDGAPGVCFDLDTDHNQCGGCAIGCGQYCAEGDCVVECPAGLDLCPGEYSCRDFETDPFACGGCWDADHPERECAANEICAFGTCTAWTPALGCAECPCENCPEGTTCCGYPEAPEVAICLTGDACP